MLGRNALTTLFGEFRFFFFTTCASSPQDPINKAIMEWPRALSIPFLVEIQTLPLISNRSQAVEGYRSPAAMTWLLNADIECYQLFRYLHTRIKASGWLIHCQFFPCEHERDSQILS
jgi:hypothetical protein